MTNLYRLNDTVLYANHDTGIDSGFMRRAAQVFLCAISLLTVPMLLQSQQDMTVEWKASLASLDQRLTALASDPGPAGESWREEAEALRLSIATFAAAHPELGLEIPGALPEHSARQALSQELDQLTAAVDEIIKKTPGSPFNLGRVEVTVSASGPPPEPVAAGMDQPEMRSLNLVNVAKALDYLPGVSIQHLSANRNEAGIMVRGFSTRGQVPLYLDGIPISVPYDGYVDFNRFIISDLAEIQVAKGYSSPLVGPNALGGTINMVTQQPVKTVDVDALIGTGSGNTLLSALHVGTRWRNFFVQGGIDWRQLDYLPLSGDLHINQYVNLPHIAMTDQLNNSSSRDERFNGRAGWTPRAGDEYVFSFINLKGQKGVPLYEGPNTAAVFRNFWTWPYWNTTNYYFHSNTRLGDSSSIKFRGFYDQFQNAIDMYSSDTYSLMNTRNAAHSMYNEHNDGGSMEFTTHALSRNTIGASFFFKDDTHKEHGIYPGISPFPLVEPVLVDRDQQLSIGVQDAVRILPRLSATVGFSADHFNGLQGQQYNAAMTGTLPFTCIASPSNTSFSGCTLHAWNFNPQASISYSVSDAGSLFLTFADRGRFPMLKDIYSTSLGAGLPNPNLQPEHARYWNIGYSHTLKARTVLEIVLFRADLRDAIESVYVTDPGGTNPASAECPNSRIVGYCSTVTNIGKEIHEGVEFQVRSTPWPRLTVNASYSYLNRNIAYDFGSFPNVSAVNTSISILPTLPKNKVIGTFNLRLPGQILAILNQRYESGILLQDTTYSANSPQFLPRSEAYATTDLIAIVPIRSKMSVQVGINNLFDRNFFYTAGFPEPGRNWFVNLRYRF
ncbi:MAG: TonB-dependent receptor [Bryobacterales bacterium]|nr:TonB-dependent receptor [Bryobacterales bacterium]MBV9398985.1 TonB-dependent receptor [Bryobacterales bacterium]